MSESGKWALAFWIMATICVGGLTFLGNAVIANDRLRADEDTRIQTIINDKVDRFILVNGEQHMAIMGDLREIKAKMGISSGK